MTDERQAGLREWLLAHEHHTLHYGREHGNPTGALVCGSPHDDGGDPHDLRFALAVAQVPAQEERHRASLTLSPKFGPALWLDRRFVARLSATVEDSRITPEEPEPRWYRDALVFVDAVNSAHGQRPPLNLARLSRLWDVDEEDIRAALGVPAQEERLDALDIDAMAAALELRDVQRGGSPHITPHNRFYREEAAALLACLPPRPVPAQEERLDVERLGKALHEAYCHRRKPMHSDPNHSADVIAAEYRALGDESKEEGAG